MDLQEVLAMSNTSEERFPYYYISHCLQAVYSLLRSTEKPEVRDWVTSKNGNIIAFISHLLYLVAWINLKNSKELPSYLVVFGQSGSKSFSYAVIKLRKLYHNLFQQRSNLSKALYIINILCILSFLNAFYTFCRKRHYRIFKKSINNPRNATSAQRIRIDTSHGFLFYLNNVLNLFTKSSHEPQADQASSHDVWDPILFCLRFFSLFNPGHILVYWLFLPENTPDTQPGLDLIKIIFLQILMSIQLCLLETLYVQKAKDISIIHENVISEYNIKFVYPRLNPIGRDYGTQCVGTATSSIAKMHENKVSRELSATFYREAETIPIPKMAQCLNFNKSFTPTYEQDFLYDSVYISPYRIQSPPKDLNALWNITDKPKKFEHPQKRILSPPDLKDNSKIIPPNSSSDEAFHNSSRKNETVNTISSLEKQQLPTIWPSERTKTRISTRRNYERGPSFFG